MPISPSTILCLHYATDNENLLRYHIGIAQTKIQLSPHPRKAPSQPQSYSHLTYILVHQCLLFLIPHHTHLLGYANFAIKPIVECFSTIFTHSAHFKRMPPCLMMQKISPLTSSLHRVMAKITIFSLQPINHHNTQFVCHASSSKLSHSFGTHELSLLLGTIFLHHFAGLSLVILRFLL